MKRNGNDKPAPAKISKLVATKAFRALDMGSPYSCTIKGEKYIRLEITTEVSIRYQDLEKQCTLDNWKVKAILYIIELVPRDWISNVLLFVTRVTVGKPEKSEESYFEFLYKVGN
jgi:hypothetical protein